MLSSSGRPGCVTPLYFCNLPVSASSTSVLVESLAAANLANWQAINEMTANSIDAWFDMNSKSHQLVIDIQIDQQKDLDKAQLILQDNAMGMDLKTDNGFIALKYPFEHR